jgi:membrane protease YdiL (CAAX protease family)
MTSIPPPSTLPEAHPEPAPEHGAPEYDDSPPWRVWAAPASVALGFGLGVFATIMVAVLATIGGSSVGHPTAAVSIIGDIVFDLAFVAAALYFASLSGRPRASDFGFRRPPLRLAVKAFLLAGVGYYVLTAVYASVLKLHGNDKLPSELGVNKSTAASIAAAAFVCVIAPIAEEFFFRGFFFGALKRWRGPWVAAVLTGLLFGLAHTGSAASQYLIPLAFLGFVLCLVRWRTGSLYPCMTLHATNNALALGVNQLSWNAFDIVALIVGANLVVAALTWPMAGRELPAIRTGVHPSTS